MLLALAGGCTPGEEPPAVRTAEPADLTAEEVRLRSVLAVTPDDADATYDLARVLAEEGQTGEAVEYFDRTVDLNPDMADRVTRMRREYLERLQQEAETLLEAGQNTEANDVLGRADILVPEDGRTAYLRGRAADTSGDLETAVPLYRSALDSDPENREYRDALASALLGLGKGRYESGDFASAFELLNEADGLRSSVDLQYLRGMVAYAWAQRTEDEMEKTDRLLVAAECFQSVLDRDPNDEDARFNLGAVLLAAERYEEAAEVYHRLILDNPEDGRLFSALSRAHSLSGMNTAALTEDAIGRALRTGEHVEDPKTWSYRAAERFPQTALAGIYARYGEPEEVITYTVPGGGLVEVWFYWEKGMIQAFREGGEVGSPFFLRPPAPEAEPLYGPKY